MSESQENSISSFTTAAILSPWFPHNRGRMLGLADAGNSLGQIVCLPLAQWLISAIGWRDTFRISCWPVWGTALPMYS
jgi:predicted MFS family arabinose efflux permease